MKISALQFTEFTSNPNQVDLKVFWFVEDCTRLWFFNRGRDQRPLHLVWSYKLLKQDSTGFYYVYSSEAIEIGLICL